MSSPVSRDRWRTVTNRVALLSLDDRFWLSLAVGVGLFIHAIYLFTHPYPAYGAGLYLAISDAISANGYALPETISGYTGDGIPFAYPPLAFYIAAVVRDLTGVQSFVYSRFVPGLLVTVSLIPYYFTAKELLGSPRRAGVATLLLAGTPAVLQWHISAGGIVRTVGFIFAIVGAYFGVRLFRSGERRWLVPATTAFGLALLTHPVYATFFGLSYLLLFTYFSRSLKGLVHGAVVAGGGIALVSPWWLQVASVHGFEIFTAAAGTHGGLGGGGSRILSELVYPVDADFGAPFFIAAYAGGLYALVKRRFLLPTWMFISAFFIGKPRFIFVAGSMLTAQLLFEVVLPAVRKRVSAGEFWQSRRRLAELAVVGLVVGSAIAVGGAFAAGAVNTHNGDSSQPSFVDSADDEAMAWAVTQTPPSAEFVVLGDAAEWFPFASHRSILVGPWGVEWTSPQRYQEQLSRYERISKCDTANCLSGELDGANIEPSYVYAPKGHYTIRGKSYQQDPGMRASMVDADRYRMVYENEGVMIFSVHQSSTNDDVTNGDRDVRRRR